MSSYRPGSMPCPSAVNSVAQNKFIIITAIICMSLLYFLAGFINVHDNNDMNVYPKNEPVSANAIIKNEFEVTSPNHSITEHTVHNISKHVPDKSLRLLKTHDLNKYSQNGEDGIVLIIFELIGVRNKYYVEFGTGTADAYQTNTRILKEKPHSWTGLLMDLHKHFLNYSNIVSLFNKYNVPSEFDFLSTDMDWKDLWISEAILESGKYKPRVIISEVNGCFAKHLAITVPRDWSLDDCSKNMFCGSSALAMTYLYQSFNYSLFYCEGQGINCFWISNDELSNADIQYFNNIENILRIIRCHTNCGIKKVHKDDQWTVIVPYGKGYKYGNGKKYHKRRLDMNNKILDIDNRCTEKI